MTSWTHEMPFGAPIRPDGQVRFRLWAPEAKAVQIRLRHGAAERHQTPWGAGINFDGEHGRQVRDFFIHNALYWLHEYRFDGLRLDAVHMIVDDSRPDFLTELARAVQEGPGRERRVHLVLENDHNAASRLAGGGEQRPPCYHAQWSDDFQHALHVPITDVFPARSCPRGAGAGRAAPLVGGLASAPAPRAAGVIVERARNRTG